MEALLAELSPGPRNQHVQRSAERRCARSEMSATGIQTSLKQAGQDLVPRTQSKAPQRLPLEFPQEFPRSSLGAPYEVLLGAPEELPIEVTRSFHQEQPGRSPRSSIGAMSSIAPFSSHRSSHEELPSRFLILGASTGANGSSCRAPREFLIAHTLLRMSYFQELPGAPDRRSLGASIRNSLGDPL